MLNVWWRLVGVVYSPMMQLRNELIKAANLD